MGAQCEEIEKRGNAKLHCISQAALFFTILFITSKLMVNCVLWNDHDVALPTLLISDGNDLHVAELTKNHSDCLDQLIKLQNETAVYFRNLTESKRKDRFRIRSGNGTTLHAVHVRVYRGVHSTYKSSIPRKARECNEIALNDAVSFVN